MCDIRQTIQNGGNGRLGIWITSLNIVKKNLFFGAGFDNFHLVYEDTKLKNSLGFKSYYIVDNAHNVYLHILITQGILDVIVYLVICLLVFVKGIKSKSILVYSLLSGFISYSIQALFNISVLQVAPIYYLIMGLILSCEK